MDELFELLKPGLFYIAGSPSYGRQDLGYSPGGAMDSFSYQAGNIALANPEGTPSLEIIAPPLIRFTCDTWIVITGASYSECILSGKTRKSVRHGCVILAKKGDILDFKDKSFGFRTYLSFRKAEHGPDLSGRRLPPFKDMAHWQHKDHTIRVLRGPEYDLLACPEHFLNYAWRISPALSAMGMRLDSIYQDLALNSQVNMISEAVSTGCVQLSPSGPIILLRGRQTVGGYPRIFNVISADIDMLAQYCPFQTLHFVEVSMDTALEALRTHQGDLAAIRKFFSRPK